jgi:orotidine-5'-phosphate decarboxylase
VSRGFSFSDRLAGLVEERRSQIVLGLDPDPARLWPAAFDEPPAPLEDPEQIAALTAAAVASHCRLAIAAAGPACVAVKLQVACFERLGGPGWRALTEAIAYAREAGLLALVDGKRGDVPVTARAYAQAMVGETPGPFGPVAGLGADAFTANPLLGRDSLEPLAEAAELAGAGVFCLVRTSNPGAAAIQDEPAEAPLHERLARLVDELGAGQVGECGLSAIGAVTGATKPELLGRLRELMPRAILLLPGVGAQGGDVAALAPAFEPHPAGGLVTASRSIVNAHAERGGDPAAAARDAAEELRAAAWALNA